MVSHPKVILSGWLDTKIHKLTAVVSWTQMWFIHLWKSGSLLWGADSQKENGCEGNTYVVWKPLTFSSSVVFSSVFSFSSYICVKITKCEFDQPCSWDNIWSQASPKPAGTGSHLEPSWHCSIWNIPWGCQLVFRWDSSHHHHHNHHHQSHHHLHRHCHHQHQHNHCYHHHHHHYGHHHHHHYHHQAI